MYVDCFVWGFWSYWKVSAREKLKLQTEHILRAINPNRIEHRNDKYLFRILTTTALKQAPNRWLKQMPSEY